MTTALIVVDLQNDFCSGGALAVPDAEAILPAVHRAMDAVDLVVATQDWHPADHGSFAANHPGQKPFDLGDLSGAPQVLWPVHCVQWTAGACFHPGLDTRRLARVFPKGTDPTVDSYSGFFDNQRRHATGLDAWLRGQGVDAVHLVGLATDYCVKATALDAADLGYTTTLILPGCRGVGLTPTDIPQALDALRHAGVTIQDGMVGHG